MRQEGVNKDRKINLQKKKIIIANHVFATAFPQHFEEYLVGEKIKSLLSIRHPLHPCKDDKNSYYLLYDKGEIKTKSYFKCFKLFKRIQMLSYIKDVFLDFWWVIKIGKKWDLYFGSNNLNTFAGIWLRRMGFVRKVVFYTVDFIPQRFSSNLLDRLYHWIDKFGVINADEVWILSPRVRDARKRYYGFGKRYDEKQILVPEGVWVKRIKRPLFNKLDRYSAVYVGHLASRMGVQIVIQAISYILRKINNFHLVVIGKGEYRSTLEELTRKIGVKEHVRFTGFIEDHKEVESIIAHCGVGVATYKEDKNSLTFYADPAKTKLYLGAGLPVVMTDSFYNARDIEKAGAGKVVRYTSKEVAKAILDIIRDEKSLKEYKRRAENFARHYAYPDLFIKNLKRIL